MSTLFPGVVISTTHGALFAQLRAPMESPKSPLGPEAKVTFDDAEIELECTSSEPNADEAYQRGWSDAVRAVRAAMRHGGSWRPDDYFAGWMDAVTLQPVDPIRLAPLRSRYARGYAAGAKEFEVAQGGGYDAE